MSEEKKIFGRADEFLALFKRGAEFSKELLVENERLRTELARLEDRQNSAAQTPEDWSKLRRELLERIRVLERECLNVRERLGQVETENSQFAQRYVEIEEENNNLANLYVASYQLHSTLDLDEVLKIIMEIVINLVGAEVFAIYLLDEESGALGAVAAEGAAVADFPKGRLGSGALGKAVAATEATCWDPGQSKDLNQPIVCVPLVVQSRPIGAISIYSLLQQKDGFSALDHELFNMLGGHAATAIFAARLYSQSERKLNTIQGFIDLLTN
ncbi:MAG: GAF domain-containing protein [Myxococcales bacterium]|nr:GAF domain-containing protein [Myxococcales bacterium]MDH5307756.1 GAF domain-containing protein [Myxococcales bacterium]MDH5566628.1 GAF domain-containing protein [Myxococcales bacterium]